MDLLQPSKIIKSKRRTISIEIASNGDMIVRAPNRLGIEEVYKFIFQKADWIIKNRTKNRLSKSKLDLSDGSTIRILGQDYIVSSSNTSRIKVTTTTIFLPDEREKSLILYLKKVLKNYISKRVEYFASIYDFKYKSVSISSAKTNWGSCSYNNALHFTFRLAMCPLDIIDYIVVHELVHTKIKNHSSEFYDRVKSIVPNYKLAVKFLKENRYIMDLI